MYQNEESKNISIAELVICFRFFPNDFNHNVFTNIHICAFTLTTDTTDTIIDHKIHRKEITAPSSACCNLLRLADEGLLGTCFPSSDNFF
jgi:hypothetical protein